MRILISLLVVPILSLLPAPAAGAVPAPVQLRVEHLTNPIGIDVAHPRFFWVLPQSGRGQKQTAYEIVVSGERGGQWDSGRVASENSIGVVYGGLALLSGARYSWKVRWWDKDGTASPYSASAIFEMGLLKASDWKTHWIAGGNQLRREFTLDAAPVRARAYVTGLGYYELWINGSKVGNRVLDPAWTAYDKRVLYATYDVTSRLRKGANAIGLMLGHGWWYKKRVGLLQLEIELAGGRKVTITTDGSWKATQGPILADSIYNGETYDATRETPGWDRPGFDDSAWKPAKVVAGPGGVLSAEMMPVIEVVDTLTPRKLSSPKPGVYVYDLGQNISGWVQLRVEGPRGARVRIRHSELIYKNGMLNTENLRSAKATDYYVLRGDGHTEVYEPRFTYHGFRYVELTGFPGTPSLASIRGRVVHTAVKPVGSFVCSKPILNSIQKIIRWGIQTNLHSIPTDCDQRDERLGWMGDAQLASETAMLNFDMAAFYTNFLRDIHDMQSADGAVPDRVPFLRKWGKWRPADPAWGSAYPLITWYMYLHYGDRGVLATHYGGIKAWADFLNSKAENHVLNYSHYGDWVAIEHTPGNLVSSFYYYWSTKIVAQAAKALGKSSDAATYHARAEAIAAAFQRKFYHADTDSYGNGTQTSNVLPLYLDIAPKKVQGRVRGSLRSNILYRHNTHLTTGIIGTKYLLPYLSRAGLPALAYELATQTTYPSWGYMVKHGATTLWELWQDKTGPSMNSHNHPMFGSVGAWYYQSLAGLRAVAQQPGYRRIIIQPRMVRDLEWASGSIETPYGTATSSWRRTEDSLQLEVTIPVNTTAEIHIPKLRVENPVITEGATTLWRNGAYQPGVAGVSGAKNTRSEIIVEAGSGRYSFRLRPEE